MLEAQKQTLVWRASVAALALVELALRLAAVDPPSLWLDDQWAALAVRQLSWREFFALKPAMPIGFFALERLSTQLSADPEWPLQVVPVLACAGQVVFAALLGHRLTGRRSLGVLAGALVVIDPLMAVFGARVKQYSTDALTMLALLYVATLLLEEWSKRRALAAAAAGVAGLLLSFPAFFAAPLLSLAWGRAWWRREPAARTAGAIALVVAFDAAAVLLFALASGQSRTTMEQYWASELMPTGSVSDALAFFAVQGWAAVSSQLPPMLVPLVLFVPLGLIALARAPKHRALALFCGLLVLEAMLAAALHRYPLGGGRTGAWLHPVLLVLLLAGFNALASLPPLERNAPVWLSAVCGLMLLGFARPSSYPECGDAEVVARAQSMVQPGDGLLIYPHAGFAAAYYSRWPSQLVAWPDFANGFQAVVTRDDSLTLPARDDYPHHLELLQPELDDFARRPHRRLFYLVGGWPQAAAHEFIVGRLTEAGWQLTGEYPRGASSLLVLEKPSPQL